MKKKLIEHWVNKSKHAHYFFKMLAKTGLHPIFRYNFNLAFILNSWNNSCECNLISLSASHNFCLKNIYHKIKVKIKSCNAIIFLLHSDFLILFSFSLTIIVAIWYNHMIFLGIKDNKILKKILNKGYTRKKGPNLHLLCRTCCKGCDC